MGNSLPSVPAPVLEPLKRATNFNERELRALYSHFLTLCETRQGGEEQISRRGFQTALGCTDGPSLFVERIFMVFDGNADGHINFSEFVTGLDILAPETPFNQRLRFAFSVYDLHNDEMISKDELRAMLTAALTENDVPLGPADIQKMVNSTFTQYDTDKDGKLSFVEFEAMARNTRDFLRPLTLNTRGIIQARLREGEEKPSA